MQSISEQLNLMETFMMVTADKKQDKKRMDDPSAGVVLSFPVPPFARADHHEHPPTRPIHYITGGVFILVKHCQAKIKRPYSRQDINTCDICIVPTIKNIRLLDIGDSN